MKLIVKKQISSILRQLRVFLQDLHCTTISADAQASFQHTLNYTKFQPTPCNRLCSCYLTIYAKLQQRHKRVKNHFNDELMECCTRCTASVNRFCCLFLLSAWVIWNTRFQSIFRRHCFKGSRYYFVLYGCRVWPDTWERPEWRKCWLKCRIWAFADVWKECMRSVFFFIYNLHSMFKLL